MSILKRERPPLTVYWRKHPEDDLSYDDALTIADAEGMQEDLEKAGFDVFIIVAGGLSKPENVDRRTALIIDIWTYVKSIGADKFGSGIDISLSDVQHSIFEIDNELRISGEKDNNFSMFYANYYELQQGAQRLMEHLRASGWCADWYNPAYIIAKREDSEEDQNEEV